MPTYEYVCNACGNEWEADQRISEDPIKKCPKCKKPKAQRLLSGGTFILKGGGWYSDLYSSSPSKSAKRSDESSASSTASAPSTTEKAETKPAASKPAKKAAKKASGD